jgi:hypothetical protein
MLILHETVICTDLKTELKVNAGLEVLTVVVMNAATFWDIVLHSPYVNQHFGGMYHFHLQGQISAQQESNMQQPHGYVRWQHSIKSELCATSVLKNQAEMLCPEEGGMYKLWHYIFNLYEVTIQL